MPGLVGAELQPSLGFSYRPFSSVDPPLFTAPVPGGAGDPIGEHREVPRRMGFWGAFAWGRQTLKHWIGC